MKSSVCSVGSHHEGLFRYAFGNRSPELQLLAFYFPAAYCPRAMARRAKLLVYAPNALIWQSMFIYAFCTIVHSAQKAYIMLLLSYFIILYKMSQAFKQRK
jgi:hypothetical protein